jgi:hypothetical protein
MEGIGRLGAALLIATEIASATRTNTRVRATVEGISACDSNGGSQHYHLLLPRCEVNRNGGKLPLEDEGATFEKKC